MAGVLTKTKGFFSVLILSKKNSTADPSSRPQQPGQSHYNKEMVVINCMDIPKHTLIGYISLSNGGWRKENID